MYEQLRRGPLSDRDILQCLMEGDIKITPYTPDDAEEVLLVRESLARVRAHELDPLKVASIDPNHQRAALLHKMLQPASIDVVLDSTITTFEHTSDGHEQIIIPWAGQLGSPTKLFIEPGQHFLLYPEQFILGSTWEGLSFDNSIIGRFEGKSSLGRIGLATHITAGFIDPGWNGKITLEMKNNNQLPIAILPGMKIGQFAFEYLSSPALVPYGESGNHYRGQSEATVADFSGFHVTDIYNGNNPAGSDTPLFSIDSMRK